MLDLINGVQIIEGCDFKLSAATKLDEVKKHLGVYFVYYDTVSTGYTHVGLVCNKTLNFEDKNYMSLCFDPDGTLINIKISTLNTDNEYYFGDGSRIAKTMENCRKWLAANCPIGRYDWGDISLGKDTDLRLFVGITICLRCEYYRKRFSEPFRYRLE